MMAQAVFCYNNRPTRGFEVDWTNSLDWASQRHILREHVIRIEITGANR